MYNSGIASGFIALTFVSSVSAYPLDPRPQTIDNDGDTLTIQKFGDEHYHYTRTIDGFLVVSNEEGVYYFANKNGESSTIKAKDEKFRDKHDIRFLDSIDRNEAFLQHRNKHPDQHRPPKSESTEKRAPWIPVGAPSNSPRHLLLPSPAKHSSGTNRFPLILVTTAGASNNLDSADFYNMANGDNYTKGGFTGSIKEYFSDQSLGKFVPSFDIYKVSVNKSLSSYKSANYQLAVDAISELANIPGFSAAPYDADNNGEVDAVGILYSGKDDSGVGGYNYKLQWDNVRNLNVGGKKFNTYFLLSQGTNPFPSIIHEFSHTMGLKDHYCVDHQGTGICKTVKGKQIPGAYAWDVMAIGMYNNDGKTPAGYSAFERNFMGWLDYTILEPSSEVTSVAPLNTHNTAYKIPVSNNDNEWFILENRQLTRWDAGLPNHGLLIWHIDYDEYKWSENNLNSDAQHQNVDIVEAGNLYVTDYYDKYTPTHQKDDPFPGSQNITAYGPFTSWAGVSQNIQLYSITENGENVCFATSSGVNVGNCLPARSSSSETSSSSSSSSSNDSTTGITGTFRSSVSVSLSGSTLHVLTATESSKEIILFDLQGNVLQKKKFKGRSGTMELDCKERGPKIVRILDSGREVLVFRY